MKSTFILWEVNNLQSEENTIYQNLTSTKNLISSEIEKCFIEATQCRTNIIKNLSEVLQNIHLKNTNLINSMKKTNEKYFGIEKLGDITLKISKILERNDMLKKEKEARNESKPTIKPPINAKLSNQRKNYDLIGNLEQKNVDETAKDIRLLSLSSKTRSQSNNNNFLIIQLAINKKRFK